MGEILFLAHRAPWPPDRGDRIRSWHVLRALASMATVHVAAFADHEEDRATAQPVLDRLCRTSHVEVRTASRAGAAIRTLPRLQPLSLGLFGSATMAEHVDLILSTRPISHVFAFSCQMAQFVPARFSGTFVMDFVDVDSAKFSAYARDDGALSPMRYIHAYEGWRLAAWERMVAHRANLSLFVSEAEAALFRQRSGMDCSRVRAIENGIDLDHFRPGCVDSPADGEGPLIVFTGQMDYRPNIEAVSGFVRDTLPLIAVRHPDARFAIVGRAPTPEVRALAGQPRVIVTGEVPDTRPWLAAADVVVAPLAVARGVQNKLLEAMAMGRPVVSSPAAAEGIDAMPGRELRVAATAREMADDIIAIVEDPAAALAMGQAARTRMEARYGWDATLAPLSRIIAGAGA